MGAWCIITVCSVSAFTRDTQAILQRKSDFLREEGAEASRLTYATSKGSFHTILSKIQRLFMLDKYILKIKKIL